MAPKRAVPLRLRVRILWNRLKLPAELLAYKLQRAVQNQIGRWKNHIEQVDLGPAFRALPDGSLVQESRTTARSEGIRNLSAKYPWTDLFDHQMFLDGFEAGERYAARSADSECKPVEWAWRDCIPVKTRPSPPAFLLSIVCTA